MNVKSTPIALAVLMAWVTQAPAATQPAGSQTGSYADMHTRQAIGRVAVSSDGRFFVYEWARPYLGWVPETKWMKPGAAKRLQTFLYEVDLEEDEPTSEYLFYPNAACTYWLGDLSPDNRHVVVYELNHDDRRVRAGAWSFDKKQMTWFAPQPDEGVLDAGTVWVTHDEFLYIEKGRSSTVIKASVLTGGASACETCTVNAMRKAQQRMKEDDTQTLQAAGGVKAPDVPGDAKLAAASANSSLAVYIKDTAEVLGLSYKRFEEKAQVVFENRRTGSAPVHETSRAEVPRQQ